MHNKTPGTSQNFNGCKQIIILHTHTYIQWWCNGQRAHIECGISWV
jgi:hypothetical protein